MKARQRIAILTFLSKLKWIDGQPLLPTIEPYRRNLFERFNAIDDTGRPHYNLGLFGRGKKNSKTCDLVLQALYAVSHDSPWGSQVYVVANDEDQAGDDLDLTKKLLKANPDTLGRWLTDSKQRVERKDGRGFIEVLPAKDAVGAHGKTYRLLCCDEIHGWRNWDLLEALQPDPTRIDAQILITSYASLLHRPGVPLFDLTKAGWDGSDPRMLFSWYSASKTTDPDFVDVDPETRANPSRASWANQEYLEQQRRRLPHHKFRRLHLNEPGVPEGSAFQVEPVLDAIARGVVSWPWEYGRSYRAAVDMSGGSNDDAVVAIASAGRDGKVRVDRIVNQGPATPFDPREAIARFAGVMREYRIGAVTLADHYAGNTFLADFRQHRIGVSNTGRSAHDWYSKFEPELNARAVMLPDVGTLEQQLLGLVWKGTKITHQSGEHDDWANAAAAAVVSTVRPVGPVVGEAWFDPIVFG